MDIAIIDYGSGNLHSAKKAFEVSVLASQRNDRVTLTSDPKTISKADYVVLPGVGSFGDCKAGLSSATGVIDALKEAIQSKGRPLLGICVGMQLLADIGYENGQHAGLGWIAGEVCKISPKDQNLKIPHMGWNTLDVTRPHALLDGIDTGHEGQHVYFVHSYQFLPKAKSSLIATTEYGGAITAVVGHGNVVGTQFHPEKSQKLGLALITNFLKWKP